MTEDFADRVLARLERLDLSPEAAARAASLPADAVERILDGRGQPPRGKALLRLAEALSTTAAYLVGLDPDAALPEEYLREDQGELGLLAPDEEALLRAYRRLDVPARAALQMVLARMSPEPQADERRARTLRG